MPTRGLAGQDSSGAEQRVGHHDGLPARFVKLRESRSKTRSKEKPRSHCEGAKGDPNRTLIWVRRKETSATDPYYAIRKGDWKLLQNHLSSPCNCSTKNDPAEKNPKSPHGKVAQDLIAP